MSLKRAYANFIGLHNEVIRRLTHWEKRASALVQKKVPMVVDNLIARNIIDSDSKNEMIENLQDHNKCLQFIDNLSENVKPRSFGVVKTSRAGAIRGERESDRVFKELLFN